MKNSFKSPLAHTSLLHSFRNVELHTPYHAKDFSPFSIELMDYTRRVQSIALAFFIVGILAISTTISYELWQHNPLVTSENALLGLVQGSLLLLASVIHGLRAMQSPGTSLQRDIHFCLAVIAFVFFLREVNIGSIGISLFWNLAETTLRIITLMLVIGFAVHVYRNIKIVRHEFGRILSAPTVIISLFACLLFAAGWPFERELFNIDAAQALWFEETFELNACLLFLVASFTRNVKLSVTTLKAPFFNGVFHRA